MNAKQMYEEHKELIYNRVHYWNKKSGTEFDDLLSVAHCAFMESLTTHNPEQAKFSTYLWKGINIALWNFSRDEKKLQTMVIYKEQFSSLPDERVFNLPDVHLNNFDEKSQEILQMLFDPNTKIENIRNKISKNSLYNYLREKGWSHSKITKGFHAIEKKIYEGAYS
jgi:DNA-directed RNA polymerase specialized sigma subunit